MIEDAVRRRRALWESAVPDPAMSARITRELDDLYAQRRQLAASGTHGGRAEIVRRARIEAELSRLMTSDV